LARALAVWALAVSAVRMEEWFKLGLRKRVVDKVLFEKRVSSQEAVALINEDISRAARGLSFLHMSMGHLTVVISLIGFLAITSFEFALFFLGLASGLLLPRWMVVRATKRLSDAGQSAWRPVHVRMMTA